jgi:hypothetical protein
LYFWHASKTVSLLPMVTTLGVMISLTNMNVPSLQQEIRLSLLISSFSLFFGSCRRTNGKL